MYMGACLHHLMSTKKWHEMWHEMWKQPRALGLLHLVPCVSVPPYILLAKKHILFLSLNDITCVGFAKASAGQEGCYFLAAFTKSLLGETELAGCLFTLMIVKLGEANNCNEVPCGKVFTSTSICLRAKNPEGQVAVCRAYIQAIFKNRMWILETG